MVFSCCAEPARPQRLCVASPKGRCSPRSLSPRSVSSPVRVPRRVGSWLLGATLGETQQAVVKAAQHRGSGAAAAVKVVPAARGGAEAFGRENHVLRHVRENVKDTEHIAGLLYSMQADRAFYLALEKADGENLATHVSNGALDEATARWVFSGVVSGMVELKRIGVAHRDVKLCNIVAAMDKGTVKLVDFGLAKVHDSGDEVSYDHAGSPGYAAPEVLQTGPYNSYHADVYSLGVTLYAAVTQELPQDAAGEFARLGELSPPLQSLLRKLTAADPGGRVLLEDILSHEWFEAARGGVQSAQSTVCCMHSAPAPGVSTPP